MVTASNPSFDACRVNACNALQMMTHGQHWREHILKLEQRRLERDQAAIEGTLETLRHAQDWSELAVASQSVLRDYLSASAAIWQEGVAAAMEGAGAWTDTARDIAQNLQDSITGLQPGAGTASALPMREWMAAFERAVGAVGGAAPNGEAGNANGAGKQAAQAQGEQHGR
jgi:hypothetical protein